MTYLTYGGRALSVVTSVIPKRFQFKLQAENCYMKITSSSRRSASYHLLRRNVSNLPTVSTAMYYVWCRKYTKVESYGHLKCSKV